MIGYTATPDFYNDYIKHERSHKYIKKYMGKNGKYIYVYNKTRRGAEKFYAKAGKQSSYRYYVPSLSKRSSFSKKAKQITASQKRKTGASKIKKFGDDYVAEQRKADERLKKSPRKWNARDWLHFTSKYLL